MALVNRRLPNPSGKIIGTLHTKAAEGSQSWGSDSRHRRYDSAVAGNHASSPAYTGPSEQIIACTDEASAREEAARQQAKETLGAEWIYLRSHGKWVAKRYVPRPETPWGEKTWRQRARDTARALLDSLPV